MCLEIIFCFKESRFIGYVFNLCFHYTFYSYLDQRFHRTKFLVRHALLLFFLFNYNALIYKYILTTVHFRKMVSEI